MADDFPKTADCTTIDYYSCEEAVKRLNEYLDHQLSEDEKVVVMKHLEICKPCFSRFSFEQSLIVSIRERVTKLCAPAALKCKLSGLLRDKGKS